MICASVNVFVRICTLVRVHASESVGVHTYGCMYKLGSAAQDLAAGSALAFAVSKFISSSPRVLNL